MKLQEVVPWGRTLAEYRQMFSLSQADLARTILGCGDGPASFNAEMTRQGNVVTSIDPIYQFSAEQIRQRVHDTYDPIVSQVRQHHHRYVWRRFPDADALGRARLAAMDLFLKDYDLGRREGRYLAQSLPALEFRDRRFNLCVCSHLLFLYSDQRSLEFHIASIYDLLRVAAEVRIFPLLTLNCEPSPYSEPVTRELVHNGFEVQIETVDYEFQKGGNQMMKISRG